MAPRERYVARGVSTTPLVVARAEGARIEDVDGRGTSTSPAASGCQNLGHGIPRWWLRSTSRSTATCTSASWSGSTSRTSRCAGGSASSRPVAASRGALLLELRRRGGRERRQDRAGRDRPAGGDRLRQRLPRADAADDDDDAARSTYKRRLRAVRARGLPRAGAVSVPRGHHGRAIAGLEPLFKREVDPSRSRASCSSRCRARAGSSPMPPDFPARLQELCDEHGILYVDDEVQSGVGRTGPVWAIEHYGVEPDLLVSGKSLGGGLPLAGVTGRAEVMDAAEPGGLGGTFGGNPVACAAALAVLDEVATRRVPRALRGARRSGCARGSTRSPTGGRGRRGPRARADARARAGRRPGDEGAGRRARRSGRREAPASAG